MTLIVGWIAKDQNGPTSAYLVSDSRYSYGNNFKVFDSGSKLLALQKSSDLLGFCGEVSLSNSFLMTLASEDHSALLFPPAFDSKQRYQVVSDKFEKYFRGQTQSLPATFYHLSKDKTDHFHLYVYSYDPRSDSVNEEERPLCFPLGQTALCVFADGSGASDFIKKYAAYSQGISGGTSRSIFQAFIDAMYQSGKKTYGGHPQLIALRRGFSFGKECGIIYKNHAYYLGEEQTIDPTNKRYLDVGWFNEEFEISDPYSLKRKPNAQIQPNPILKKK
jgi:hypothetical protein